MAMPLEDFSNRALTGKPSHGRRWGLWQYDHGRLVLIHRHDRYEVDLEDMSSSAEMLDWIFQIQRWASPQEMADLVQAFHDLFNPQANLCRGGGDRRLDPAKLLRRQSTKGPRRANEVQV